MKSFIRLFLVLAVIALLAFVYWQRQPHAAKIREEDVENATVPASMDGTHPCVYATLMGEKMVTGVGDCAMPTEPDGAVDRFEADLRYGGFVVRQTDLQIKDVFDVPLTRTYFSEDWISTNQDHSFGFNTNHPYDVAPVGSRYPYTYLMLVLEDGDMLYFGRISKGTSFADAVYMHTETSTKFYGATIAWNGNGWTLRRRDGVQIVFPEAYMSKSLAQGAAYEISDAKGDKLVLQRDEQRNLQQIKTPHGHWIRFQYSGMHITQAEDDGGKWTKYGYNGEGMLAYAVHDSGAERHYEYDGRLMTSVTDENGRELVHNWYQDGRLARQTFANGDSYEYSYISAPRRFDAVSVDITMPDHSSKRLNVAGSVPGWVRAAGN